MRKKRNKNNNLRNFNTLEESFIDAQNNIVYFRDFVNSLRLVDTEYRVLLWGLLKNKGISLGSLKKIPNKLFILERLLNDTIKDLLMDKFLGIDEIFNLASGFNEEEQILYMIYVNPTNPQKKEFNIPGKKLSMEAKDLWKELYKKNINLSKTEIKLIELDEEMINPYETWMRNDND